MKDSNKMNRIVFVGDNKGFADIEQMVNNDLVAKQKFDHLTKTLY